MITQIFEALKEPFTALGRWLNPDRHREARKDQAIESAAELFLILRRQGQYKLMADKRLKSLEVHYQKRFDSWRNG
jgi:hypothetical protein